MKTIYTITTTNNYEVSESNKLKYEIRADTHLLQSANNFRNFINR